MSQYPIVVKPLRVYRSDNLPSDRWRLKAVDAGRGLPVDLCECPSAHASSHEAANCEQANKNAEAYIYGRV